MLQKQAFMAQDQLAQLSLQAAQQLLKQVFTVQEA
jgi:hypothetical protein